MNYNVNNNKCQIACNCDNNNVSYLVIPSTLERFVNTKTKIERQGDRDIYCFYGLIELSESELICSCCGNKMHKNKSYDVIVKHIPIGGIYSVLRIKRYQLKCCSCNATKMQEIPFLYDNHFITNHVKNFINDLLSANDITIKKISSLTGVNRNLIKEIDKERLIKQYTVNGEGKELIKPDDYSRYLAIDEFKLHDGYKYATHIIDYDTGHILWIAKGKKKQVVYDFIKHVGLEWMSHVKAVGCDMNSDFEEAFKEMCPHIKIVYDHFHIVKNFNEKVINKVRIEEQQRLISEGKAEEARRLKRTKFILTSNQSALERKDKEAEEGKTIGKESNLFNLKEQKTKGGKTDRLNELVDSNTLFLAIELIKDILAEAYHCDDEEEMSKLIFDIMELCEETGNKHFLWFRNLLYNHFDGIVSHATIKISSGKIEGINNKIKTLRRQAYGYPDDEYFFLKLIDMSRN